MIEVYVPTWDNKRTIARCLAAITVAIPDAEIVVVDKFSSDGTDEIAEAYGARVVKLDANLGEAMAWICNHAGGEWFVRVDSDGILPFDWYRRMTNWRSRLLETDCRLGAVCNKIAEHPAIDDAKLHSAFMRAHYFNESHQYGYVAKNYGRFQPNGAVFRTEAVKGYRTHAAVLEDMLIGKYIMARGWNTYVVPVFIRHEQHLDLENIMHRARVVGAWWRETAYTSLPALLFNLFRGPVRMAYGARLLTLRMYVNYVAGWFMRGRYVEDYRWAKD